MVRFKQRYVVFKILNRKDLAHGIFSSVLKDTINEICLKIEAVLLLNNTNGIKFI